MQSGPAWAVLLYIHKLCRRFCQGAEDVYALSAELAYIEMSSDSALNYPSFFYSYVGLRAAPLLLLHSVQGCPDLMDEPLTELQRVAGKTGEYRSWDHYDCCICKPWSFSTFHPGTRELHCRTAIWPAPSPPSAHPPWPTSSVQKPLPGSRRPRADGVRLSQFASW